MQYPASTTCGPSAKNNAQSPTDTPVPTVAPDTSLCVSLVRQQYGASITVSIPAFLLTGKSKSAACLRIKEELIYLIVCMLRLVRPG